MKQCPNCNGNFSDEQLFCPDCGIKLEEAQLKPQAQAVSGEASPPPAKRSNGLVVFLMAALGAALIAVGYFYSNSFDGWESSANYQREMQRAQAERDEAQHKLDEMSGLVGDLERELDKLSDLAGVYGYASEDFYAGKSVVVLKAGETREIPIYANRDVFGDLGLWVWWDDLYSNQLSVTWSSELSEPNCQNLKLFGISPGCVPIKLAFLDDSSADLTDSELSTLLSELTAGSNVFEVLVIVTD